MRIKSLILAALCMVTVGVYAQSNYPFNGLDMNMGNLSRLSDAKTRSISPENFTGEKGKGGMADPVRDKDQRNVANAHHAAKDLGKGARLQKEAEQKAEEEKKAAEEAAKQQEEQQTQAAQTGQAIVDYACQFIGNPYVWGGTSLTNGADCSGFVQSVFAHFGISLPRTTWDMENVGTAVSYDQAVAGDIILYNGHVGIYMGNGQIVNAINSAKGIGILPATYTNIVTVRRLV